MSTELSNSVSNNPIMDDDIDESFDVKPVEINLPAPLSNDELNKVHTMMKSKSNKELVTIITNLVTSRKDDKTNDTNIESTILKNLSSASKRELLNMMGPLLHQQNKHVVFQDSHSLDTVSEQNKTSHDELRKKLHNKIYMSNKNNLKKMYEKMSEGLTSFQNSGQETEQETEQVRDQTNSTNNNSENDIIKETKSKKKQKKLDREKLQSQLMDQMASLIKEQQLQ